MYYPITALIFALETEILVALIGVPASLAGVYATIYATRKGRRRDIEEAVNSRITTVFARDDATIARLEADRAQLDLSVANLSKRLDESEEREKECLKREELLERKFNVLEKQMQKLEKSLLPRREEAG